VASLAAARDSPSTPWVVAVVAAFPHRDDLDRGDRGGGGGGAGAKRPPSPSGLKEHEVT
ncbi:hypothetical protein JRQ81_013357, partial [Phrynocephalus forsythii]